MQTIDGRCVIPRGDVLTMTAIAYHPHRALTVLLAPRAQTEEIVAVLADYCRRAAGRVRLGRRRRRRAAARPRPRWCGDGASEPVVLQQLLTGERYERMRLARAGARSSAHAGDRVPLAAEQTRGADGAQRSVGARHHPAAAVGDGRGGRRAGHQDQALVLEGWHNLLIAPEDSAAPGLGAVIMGPLTDPLDLARHVAPVICGVAGLWAGMDTTPFDTVEILPGQTVRAVRGFYRRLDTRRRRGPAARATVLPAVACRCRTAGGAGRLRRRRCAGRADDGARAVDQAPRCACGAPAAAGKSGAQAISIWAALKMFLKFMGAALRRAPSAWMSAVPGSVSSVLAATVQGTVFGRQRLGVRGGRPTRRSPAGRSWAAAPMP